MQFYRGLEIGVAKPTAEEQRAVPHHLIDILDITEKYDIFRFCADVSRETFPLLIFIVSRETQIGGVLWVGSSLL